MINQKTMQSKMLGGDPGSYEKAAGGEGRGSKLFPRLELVSVSLRSKRFRLVSEQRKTEERYSRFWPREK